MSCWVFHAFVKSGKHGAGVLRMHSSMDEIWDHEAIQDAMLVEGEGEEAVGVAGSATMVD